MVVDEGSEGEEVEQVRKESPYVRVSVFPQALVIETIHLCNLSRLVVPAKDCYSVAIAQFESNEQRHCLNGIVSTVDVIAHEKVVGIWRVSANTKKLGKIMLDWDTGVELQWMGV